MERKYFESNESPLNQPIQPPVDEDTRENNEHHSEEQSPEDNPPGVGGSEARPAEEHTQPEKENRTHPVEQGRAKKVRTRIKRNWIAFLAMVFAGVYAIAFVADTYISKRAYLGIDPQVKTFVSILPGNEGVEMRLRNAGQTVMRRVISEVWLLPDALWVTAKGAPKVEVLSSPLTTGAPFGVQIVWSNAAKQIPFLMNGDIGMGFIWRVFYQDAFFVWHCESFSVDFAPSSPEKFHVGNKIPICGSQVKTIRYFKRRNALVRRKEASATGMLWRNILPVISSVITFDLSFSLKRNTFDMITERNRLLRFLAWQWPLRIITESGIETEWIYHQTLRSLSLRSPLTWQGTWRKRWR